MLPCPFREKGFLLTTIPNNPYFFSLFLIILSWTLTFNMLTEACRGCSVALEFFVISLSLTLLRLQQLATPWKTGSCMVSFLLVNLSHCRVMLSRLFGDGLTSLTIMMLINNCFAKIIADVISFWHCVNTPKCYWPANCQNFAFIEVLKLFHGLIKY